LAQPYADYPDFAKAFEDLTARSVAHQVRVVQRYRDLMQRVAAGEVDAVTLRAEYDRLVTEQSGQLARDLTALGVRYYQSMLDLNRAYVDRFFDDLAASARSFPVGDREPEPNEPPPQAPAIVELRLQGRAGESVETGFAVENGREEPADVVFLLSDFSGDGVEPFRPALELDPPRLRLEPHTEQTVNLRLQLDPEQFQPGSRYHAQVLVRGTEELELRLVVDVDE
jgi:hypothetical protein